MILPFGYTSFSSAAFNSLLIYSISKPQPFRYRFKSPESISASQPFISSPFSCEYRTNHFAECGLWRPWCDSLFIGKQNLFQQHILHGLQTRKRKGRLHSGANPTFEQMISIRRINSRKVMWFLAISFLQNSICISMTFHIDYLNEDFQVLSVLTAFCFCASCFNFSTFGVEDRYLILFQ